MSTYLKKRERERALEKIRGKAGASSRTGARKATGPAWAKLELEARVEFERYAHQAGADWRSDLIADCLRGGTRRRARFADVLCPMIRKHGVRWLRELDVPWQKRGPRG